MRFNNGVYGFTAFAAKYRIVALFCVKACTQRSLTMGAYPRVISHKRQSNVVYICFQPSWYFLFCSDLDEFNEPVFNLIPTKFVPPVNDKFEVIAPVEFDD